ncbi:MAG: HmuY family protein, partial [Longimicrobiales bacterium]
MTTHQVSAVPTKAWKIRGAGSSPEYTKLHVTQIADATQAGARVTIEYAVQPAAGAAMGVVRSIVLDGRTAPVYFDFASGAVSDASNWDIMLDGYAIRINAGVSGSGGAGAVLAGESFEAMTDASDAPAQIYRGDAFGGVFTSHAWYRYNLDGNHTIFPTYDVFLIRSGAAIYKVQITGYYSTTGESRRITFRYARIDS